MDADGDPRLHWRRRRIRAWSESNGGSEWKRVRYDADRWSKRLGHHLQNSSTRWELGVSGDPHFHRWRGRKLRIGRQNDSESWAALRRSYYWRKLWERRCF